MTRVDYKTNNQSFRTENLNVILNSSIKNLWIYYLFVTSILSFQDWLAKRKWQMMSKVSSWTRLKALKICWTHQRKKKPMLKPNWRSRHRPSQALSQLRFLKKVFILFKKKKKEEEKYLAQIGDRWNQLNAWRTT